METEFDTFADIHVGCNISNEYIPKPFVELMISLLCDEPLLNSSCSYAINF